LKKQEPNPARQGQVRLVARREVGGAVVGGLIVGVTENLVGTYLIASQLKLTVALALIILVLVFKPNGLFGTAIVRRV